MKELKMRTKSFLCGSMILCFSGVNVIAQTGRNDRFKPNRFPDVLSTNVVVLPSNGFANSHSTSNTEGTNVDVHDDNNPKCAKHWIQYKNNCYKFSRGPPRTWDEARGICIAYRNQEQDHADMASISTIEVHQFISKHLSQIDPQRRPWYTSGRQKDDNSWINYGDKTKLTELQNFFLMSNVTEKGQKLDYLTYSFLNGEGAWRFRAVSGRDKYFFICQMPVQEVKQSLTDKRSYSYGQPLGNPRFYARGPHFIRQPNNTIFSIANRKVVNDVSLSCLASGYPAPTYKWFKEKLKGEKEIEEEVDPLKDPRVTISGGRLIINNPDQGSDRGKYFCKAKNSFGTIRSRSASIMFEVMADFTQRRSSEVGSENWGKSISCDPAHNFHHVEFKWTKDFHSNFVVENSRIMVSKDGYLYFSALDKSDRGNYSCNIQSQHSALVQNGPFFQLDVSPHPNNQQLRFPQGFPKYFPEAPVAGDEVRLECVAFGYPVATYNWTRKTMQLPSRTIVTNNDRVLILPKVRIEDAGEYVCTASNDKVSITGSVIINIQARPVFSQPIDDKHVDESSDVIWICEAFGIPDVKYQWMKNGKILNLDSLDERYKIEDNTLTIKNVEKHSDEGMFQCLASNDLDVSFSSAQLRVLAFPPTFAKDPLRELSFVAEGENVTIRCNPEGAPQPDIVWRKDGNKIASGGKYIIYPSGNLHIRKVNNADAGNYTCRATNKYGKAESTGKMVIKQGPSFKSGIRPDPIVTAKVGENLELKCKADSDQSLEVAYSWRLNGLPIQLYKDEEMEKLSRLKSSPVDQSNSQSWFKLLNDHQKLLHSSSSFLNKYLELTTINDRNKRYRPGGLDGSLRIYNLTDAEAGQYECIAKTTVGSVSTVSSLKVHGPPGPPGGISGSAFTSTSGTLAWTDGALHGRKILTYRIEGRTDHNKKWFVIIDKAKGEDIRRPDSHGKVHGRKQFTMQNKLSPYNTYQFRISASNDIGFGPYSLPSSKYNTLPDKPSKAPSNIRGGGGRTGDLTILWDPLAPEDQNGPGVFYKVFYRRTGLDPEEIFHHKDLQHLGNIDLYVIRIPQKYFYSTYEIKIQAFNDLCKEPECQGPISDQVTIYSAEDLPQAAPTNVISNPFNCSSINITWTPIPLEREKIRGKLVGYRIKYWNQDLNEIVESQYFLSRSVEPHALISGLQPNTYYWVRVMALNSAGPGPESERILDKTFKLRPQKPPTAVQVHGINPSTIRVAWRYGEQPAEEEPLTGFKVRYWESDKDISSAYNTVIYMGNPMETTITDLTPGKTYYLRVLAFSLGGEGKMSSPAWQFQMGDPDALNTGSHLMIQSWSIFSLAIIAAHTQTIFTSNF